MFDHDEQTSKKSAPWLRCNHCLSETVQLGEIEGMTAVHAGDVLITGNLLIHCPHCGAVRQFISVKITGD